MVEQKIPRISETTPIPILHAPKALAPLLLATKPSIVPAAPSTIGKKK